MYQYPLVSIITPSYNSSKYIENTIESVCSQTYLHWEMIIIDDNSNDNSAEIIEKFCKKDKRIKLLRNVYNLGAAKSRNKATEHAQGQYIAFLDSDDIWYPEKLEKQLKLMQRDDILLSYTAYNTMNESGEVVGIFPVKKSVTYNDLLKTSSIGTLTTMYNAKELGKFYFENIGHEDYVMKLQILKKIKFAQGIQEPLANYRIVQNSLSSNKIQAAIWQWYIYRKVEKLSLLKSIYYFLHYTYHGVFKYRRK